MNKYIELNAQKQAITKFNVNYPTMDSLQNAGLLLNPDTIVVDFDGDNQAKEQSIIEYIKNTYPTLNVETTRGIHFYYKKPQEITVKSVSDVITTSGFQVDYKTGNNSYVVVKQNGVERNRSQELDLTNLPELPHILYPLGKNKENLSNMCDGDGRNNSIFSHLCNVRRKYPTLDIKEIGEFINNNIFTDPLDFRELNNTINIVLSRNIEAEQKQSKPLQTISALELHNKELEPTKFIVDNMLPQGLNLIASPPKYRQELANAWSMFIRCKWREVFKQKY